MSGTILRDQEALRPKGVPETGWLARLRQRGLDRFQDAGYPTSRDEDWRFINLAPLTTAEFRLAGEGPSVRHEALAPYRYPGTDAMLLVFVNGRFVPGLSDLGSVPAGVTVGNLASLATRQGDLLSQYLGQYARIESSGFTALNTALLADGLLFHVARDVQVPRPVHALFVTTGDIAGVATHPRNLVVLERGARASVIESYAGLSDGAYFTNAVTEAIVGDGANLEYLKIQRESEQAFHIGTTHLHHGQASRGTSHSVSLGAILCRNNLEVVLDGSGIEAQMLGLYMGRDRQEVDNHTTLLHAHPNCSSREVYKGILDGHAHGVFNGKIYVTPIAQKTDAKQTNRALLLSDHARIDTKPQLEIFADDVKCTHGATVGALDQQASFYLKSRGIAGPLARKILTYAFAAEVLEELPFAEIRESLEAVVMARLEARG